MTSRMGIALFLHGVWGVRRRAGATPRGLGAPACVLLDFKTIGYSRIARGFALLAMLIYFLGDSGSLAGAQTAVATPPVFAFDAGQVNPASGSGEEKTFTFAVSGYTGSYIPVPKLHYGTDFLFAGSALITCTTVTATSENCTVTIVFLPTLPGGRKDALFLYDPSSGKRLATVLLYGVGQAPLSLIQPGVVTNITPYTASQFSAPGTYIYNSVEDGNGTQYYITETGAAVISLPKGGVPTVLPISFLTANDNPRSIGIDGAGVLYIGAASGNAVYGPSIVTYDTVQGIQGTVTPPFTDYWDWLAVGNTGKIYEANENAYTGVTKVYTLTPGTSNANPPTATLSMGQSESYVLAVDSAEDLFISGGDVNEITASGVQTTVNNQDHSAEQGIAVDAANTLYSTRYPGGNGYGIAELQNSDYNNVLAWLDQGVTGESVAPLGFSLDADGTLYVGDYFVVDKIDRSQGVIDFGLQTAKTSVTKDFYIYNGGNETLIIESINFDSGDTVFSYQGGSTCIAVNGSGISGAELAPGQICMFPVTMNAPHGGTFTGTVTVATNSLNNSSTTQTVALNGEVYGAYVTASPASLDFGMQGLNTTALLMVTLNSVGYYYPAQLSVGSATLPAGYSISTPASGSLSCSNLLAAGQSCQITVTFDPTTEGAHNGKIAIPVTSYGFSQWPAASISVSGTGTVVTLTPASLSFTAPQGSSSDEQLLTLTNTGSSPVNITDYQLQGVNPAAFTLGKALCAGPPVSGVLKAHSSCAIGITFNPPVVSGLTTTIFTAQVAVYDTDTATSPQTAILTGTGTPPLPILLSILETIHVMDTEAVILPTILNIFETIHASDDLTSVMPAMQLAINEQIHVSDAPAAVPVKMAPIITWANPAAITYGQALSSTQLNATASVAGSFAYSPLAGRVLDAGSQPLSVTFTPSNQTDYNTVMGYTVLVVNPASMTVTTVSLSKVVGTANPTFSATYSGLVNGDTTAVLGGSPSLTTSALTSSPVGTYPITIALGGITDANYSYTLVNGTLTVVAVPTVVLTWTAPLSGSASTGYKATVKVINNGTGAASNVTLSNPTLGSAAGTPSSQSLGNLAAGGGSATVTVNFPGSAGADGASVVEKIPLTYAGGSAGGSAHATLP